MTKFRINKKEFREYLKCCSMKGIIQYQDSKPIKNCLFYNFNIEVRDGKLKVLTMDPYMRGIQGKFVKKDVDILEEGFMLISDYDLIDDCLGGKGLSDEILVYNDQRNPTTIFIETENDLYEIRQRGKFFIDELEMSEENKAGLIEELRNWDEWHEFERTEDGKIMLFMNHPKAKVPYPMRIVVHKDSIMKCVDDTLKITKDNKTRIVSENGILRFMKGEKNAKIKSSHEIEYLNLLDDEDVIQFDEEFYNIHTIIPNMFEDIEFNIRRVKSNNVIALYIVSEDQESKIEINVGMGSIIK